MDWEEKASAAYEEDSMTQSALGPGLFSAAEPSGPEMTDIGGASESLPGEPLRDEWASEKGPPGFFPEDQVKTETEQIMENKRMALVMMGNFLEWYEFTSFGLLIDIIKDVMFPDTLTVYHALVASLAVYSAAFVTRPLGGMFFGHIGDTYGPQAALTLSLVTLTAATTMLGLTPSYQTLGVIAPLFLAIFRAIQGFAVGGEISSGAITAIETFPLKVPRMSAVVAVTVEFGSATGCFLVVILRLCLTYEQMRSFGWRVPFLTSIVLGMWLVAARMQDGLLTDDPGALVRRTREQLARTREQANHDRCPLRKTFKKSFWTILKTIGVVSYGVYMYSFYFIWLPIFLCTMRLDLFSDADAYSLRLIWIGVHCLSVWAWYLISRCLASAEFCWQAMAWISLIIAIPSMHAYSYASFPIVCMIGVLNVAIFSASYPQYGWMVLAEKNLDVRTTSIGISFNVSAMVFSGLAPLVLTALSYYNALGFGTTCVITMIPCLSCAVGLAFSDTLLKEKSEKSEDDYEHEEFYVDDITEHLSSHPSDEKRRI